MALLLAAPDRDIDGLRTELLSRAPDLDLRVWPELRNASEIEFAVAWRPPRDIFEQLQALRAVSSLGAGVDGLLDHPGLPPEIPVGRIAGPRLAADMAAYLVAMVISAWRDFDGFRTARLAREWRPYAPSRAPRIGLMGGGCMARAAARAFSALELEVAICNRSGSPVEECPTRGGSEGLNWVASRSDFLINLLPLTADTRGILNASLFSAMPEGSTLINVGRGAHLIELDLIEALDRVRPSAAILDVFESEPLPRAHPFWDDERITITPHSASINRDDETAELILESYRRVRAGGGPMGQVERNRGY